MVRNRMRRRLRALLSSPPNPLGPGWYLFGARPEASTTSFEELSAMLTHLVQRVNRSAT